MISRVKILRSIQAEQKSGFEWCHIYLGALPIPPEGRGSYNYFVWDLLQRRSEKDLLVTRFFPDSLQGINQAGCAAVQVQLPDESKQDKLLRLVSKVARQNTVPQKALIKTMAHIVKQYQVKRVKVWGSFGALGLIRQELPDHQITYSQHHFDYRMSLVENYAHCDHLIVLTRNALGRAFDNADRLPPFPIVIPNGVDVERYSPAEGEEKAALQKRLGIPRNKFVIIFPANLTPEKGTQYLLKWIQHAAAKERDWHFVVPADFSNLHQGHRLALSELLEKSDNVSWYGGVIQEEMEAYYKASDVALATPVWREGFGLIGAESMACGLPVIATGAGAFLEYVHNNYNGFLSRPEYLYEDTLAHLRTLHTNADLRARLGENARRYAETRLDRKRMIDNHLAYLEGRIDDIKNNLDPV